MLFLLKIIILYNSIMLKHTLYTCNICNSKPDQISHHLLHIATDKHKTKRELFRYKCNTQDKQTLYDKYNTCDIDTIIKLMETNNKLKLKLKHHNVAYEIDNISSLMADNNSISNREDLKDKIHELHNFLRNNGAGYGMNALKVFNIIYGLKKLDQCNLYEYVDMNDPECHFNHLLELAQAGKDEELGELIIGRVLDQITDSKIKDLLMYEIPKQIKGNVFSHLVKEIHNITNIEQTSNVQLAGKVYEYFIGRDESAISELGAYFTDRHIVNYIYSKLDIQLEADGSIGTMIDMFGGSGGFTTGYIHYLKDTFGDQIDWTTELDKIYHYDMNEDVNKSAALELFCITGEFPDMKKNILTSK